MKSLSSLLNFLLFTLNRRSQVLLVLTSLSTIFSLTILVHIILTTLIEKLFMINLDLILESYPMLFRPFYYLFSLSILSFLFLIISTTKIFLLIFIIRRVTILIIVISGFIFGIIDSIDR